MHQSNFFPLEFMLKTFENDILHFTHDYPHFLSIINPISATIDKFSRIMLIEPDDWSNLPDTAL